MGWALLSDACALSEVRCRGQIGGGHHFGLANYVRYGLSMLCVEHNGQHLVLYVSMLCLCCSALGSIFTYEVHKNDIIAASRDVAQHRVQCAYVMVCVHAYLAETCYLQSRCQNRPQHSEVCNNSLSVALVVFACSASACWHDPCARQVPSSR